MASSNLIEQIIHLSEKYAANTILSDVKTLAVSEKISIGFLGEFSSGKSTLINAMLGRKILPAMKNPTSKSIVHIMPDSEAEAPSYFKRETDEDTPISALEFSDIALGKEDGQAVVVVPSSDLIMNDVHLIDTPGIQSLDDTDYDITFGFLPFLDGAVICQDINNGSLTQSVLDFLAKPEVAPVLDRMLIAITHADTKKSPQAAEDIKTHVVKTLRSSIPGITSPEDKVSVLSAKLMLEEGDTDAFQDFSDSYTSNVLARKRSMCDRRRAIQARKLAESLRDFLEMGMSSLELKDGELRDKEKQISEDLKALETQRANEKTKLRSFQSDLEANLLELSNSYVDKFRMANDEFALEEVSSQFNTDVAGIVESRVETFFSGFEVPAVISGGTRVRAMITDVMNNIELAKKLGTGILAAVLIPGGGAADVIQAFIGGALSDKIDDVNPLSYIGDFVGQLISTSKLRSSLPQLAAEISERVSNSMGGLLENSVFIPLENEIHSTQQAVAEVMEIRKQSESEKLNYLKEMKKDFELLTGTLKQAE